MRRYADVTLFLAWPCLPQAPIGLLFTSRIMVITPRDKLVQAQ
jgi:hypothetical protein